MPNWGMGTRTVVYNLFISYTIQTKINFVICDLYFLISYIFLFQFRVFFFVFFFVCSLCTVQHFNNKVMVLTKKKNKVMGMEYPCFDLWSQINLLNF
jgi:hypothetical protein